MPENDKKKMGRPTDNPRTEKVGFRMSKKEVEDIQICADKMKTQRVNAVVEGIKLLKNKLTVPGTNELFDESELSDIQFRAFIKMIAELINKCETKDEAIQLLEQILNNE